MQYFGKPVGGSQGQKLDCLKPEDRVQIVGFVRENGLDFCFLIFLGYLEQESFLILVTNGQTAGREVSIMGLWKER